MNKDLKKAGIILILIVAFGDAFTTFLGLASIFKPSSEYPVRFIFCLIPSLAILVLLLFTKIIWRMETKPLNFVKVLWGIAVVYDLWTSFRAALIMATVGAKNIVATTELLPLFKELTFELVITTILGTVIMSGCPILFSYILEEK